MHSSALASRPEKKTSSIRIERLASPAQLEAFSRGQHASFGGKALANKHPVTTSELARYSFVYGAYRGDELVGGYVINEIPTRTWNALSDAEKARVRSEIDLERDACEIVGVWKARGLSPLTFMLFVWSSTVVHLLRTGKSRIFGMAYRAHRMNARYQALRPTVVRPGEADDDLCVFHYSRLTYVLTFVAALTAVLLAAPRARRPELRPARAEGRA